MRTGCVQIPNELSWVELEPALSSIEQYRLGVACARLYPRPYLASASTDLDWRRESHRGRFGHVYGVVRRKLFLGFSVEKTRDDKGTGSLSLQ
jgi:hypothetical protein